MPNKSEILKKIDHVYEIVSEAASAHVRLYDLLKNREFIDADRQEAFVLVKGIDHDQITMALGDIRRDIDPGGDDESDSEPANPDLDFCSMSLFERVASGEAGGDDLQEVGTRLLDAARILIELSANAGKGATTATSRANELIELAQSLQTEANQPRRGICVA